MNDKKYWSKMTHCWRGLVWIPVVFILLTGIFFGTSSFFLPQQDVQSVQGNNSFVDIQKKNDPFRGYGAYIFMRQLVGFGPRSVGTQGNVQTRTFLQNELFHDADSITTQPWIHTKRDGRALPLENIIARFDPEKKQRIVLATHYDTRSVPDAAVHGKSGPMLGANNGGSGTALLLELARVFADKKNRPAVGVDLVFFDGEEGENGIPDAQWQTLGSQYFVDHSAQLYPNQKPQAAIVVDVIGGTSLTIPIDQNSQNDAPDVLSAFLTQARMVAPDIFTTKIPYAIADDHLPLNAIGIPSILLIDYDYPWLGSTGDTLDKCSAESLQKVGDALLQYLYSVAPR